MGHEDVTDDDNLDGGEGGEPDVHVPGDDLVKKLRVENKRLSKENRSQRQQLTDLNQRLGRLEQQQDSAAEEKEREAGEFAKIDARQKSQIDDLKSKLEKETARADGLADQVNGGKFRDRVAAQTGIKNSTMLRGLLREAAEAEGFELAPEQITDTAVEEAAKAIRDLAPELFTGGAGGSPAAAGHRGKNKPDGEKSGEGKSRGTQLGEQLTEALRQTRPQQ